MKKVIGIFSAFWSGVNFDILMIKDFDLKDLFFTLFYLGLAIFFLTMKPKVTTA